jgi:tetratricopeptide (TPR) repeat protein
LPWETLRLSDHRRALAVNDRLLVSRYLPSSDVRSASRPPPADQWQVGLLVANPEGLAERELAQVSEAEIRADLEEALGPEAIKSYKATLGGLRDCLDAGHDVLCLAAHGGITERGGEPFVYLERGDGTIRGVTAADLAAEFTDIEDGNLPRMVVLLSCQSGAGGELDPAQEPRLSLAARLVEQGVPAVVAMQESISVKTGRQFLRELFEELKEECLIDQSVATARRAVYERPDWWMPVLFMNMTSGRLCQEARPPLLEQFKRLPRLQQVALTAVMLMLLAILGVGVAALLSGQPAEDRVMSGEFNVAVAEFMTQNEAGQPVDSEDAELMADGLYKRLANTVDELDLKDIDYQRWPPEKTGPVRGNSVTEREAAAAELADKIKADVIVSGVFTDSGQTAAFSPEFYVDERGFHEAAELTGRHQLGRELLVFLPFSGIIDAENPALVARAKALSLMTVGLAYYALSSPDKAQDYFMQALDIEDWLSSAGQEVAHLMLGKTNLLLAEQLNDVTPLATAEFHFAAAATIDPDYERAKIGRAAVTYMMAIGDPDEPAATIDIALLNEAEADFVAALDSGEIKNDPVLEARIRSSLGQIYLARVLQSGSTSAWLEPARDEFLVVLAIYDENEQVTDIAGHAMARLGRIAWLEGERDAAVDYYDRATQLVSPFYQAFYLSVKAEVLVDMGDMERACEALNRAERVSETYADEESFERYRQQQVDLGC